MKRILIILLLGWSTAVASLPLNNVHVRDYGAVPDDGLDDTVAIRAAFDAANASGATVHFDNGEYNVSGQEPDGKGNYLPIFSLYDYDNLTIEGNGALLNARNWAHIFLVDRVTNLTIRNFTFDWEDDLPFTGGKIVATGMENVGGTDYAYLDVEVAAPHTARSGVRAEAFLQYDTAASRPAIDGYDIYNAAGFDVPCAIPASGILRCYKSNPNSVTPVGTDVIVRHQVYGYDAFGLFDVSNVLLENITIYAAPGMGIYTQGTNTIDLDQFTVRIKPGSGRWMSTTADGSHFDSNRGTLTVTNSFFEGMGDDAFNVHTSYFRILDLPGTQTMHLELARTGFLPPQKHPRVGDTLQVGTYPNPLQPIASLTVNNVVDNGDNTLDVTVAEAIPAAVSSGDLVANRSSVPTMTTVQACQVWGNRARGMLLQAPNIVVENCHFGGTSGPAILIQADGQYFYEGVPAEDVTIRDSTFQNNNYGATQEEAIIVIEGAVDSGYVGAGVFHDITIEDNSFRNSGGDPAVFVNSADAVAIGNNTTGYNMLDAVRIGTYNTCNILIDGVPWCASYQTDFQGSSPPNTWQYLWNANGPIGRAASYTALLWNGSQYDSDGLAGLPDSSSMAYGHLTAVGGHAGQGSAQSGAAPRYAIAAYTIPVAAPYEITNSYITALNPDCSAFDDGIDLRLYVNDTLVANHTVASGDTVHFDTFLGELSTGDVVYIAVGPHDWDDCDAFAWDFTVARVTHSSGAYANDFQAGTPPPRWQYLWNAGGAIGDRANYTALYWNGTMYDVDGDPDYPDSDTNLGWGQLSRLGGHPGPASDQGQTVDRYVIAAFTVTREGAYEISDSIFTADDTACGDGNELRVYVNNTQQYTNPIANGDSVAFDQELGMLQAGDVVYVAAGPHSNDNCDHFSWDFSIHLLPPVLDQAVYLPMVTGVGNVASHQKGMN